MLRGVEIYKGKPILYSLGDFIFQNETLLRLPSENYEPQPRRQQHVNDFNDARYNFDKSGFPAEMILNGVAAAPNLSGSRRSSSAFHLHPIGLGNARTRSVRAMPVYAERGQRIYVQLDKLYDARGKKISVRNGIDKPPLGTFRAKLKGRVGQVDK